MEPPRFARSPAFSYDLSSFLKPGSLEDGLRMVATNATSVEHARSALKAHSAFDSSQAEAFIDCMCREVAMIQGPPGTGKSWIGVKLVQMLLEQNIKSIFVLAYTNHALDQFLHDLYDNATTDIIRCGSRSKDPIIQALNLFDACKDSGVGVRLKLRQEIRDQYAKREEIEKELKAVCAVASIANSHHIRYSDIADLLRADYPLHAALLSSVPLEVIFAHEEQTAGGWQVVGQERGGQRPPPQDAAFTWWKAGWDIDVLKTQKAAYEPRTRHESFEDGDEANAEPSSRAEAEEEEEELPAWMLALFNDDEAEQAQASTASPVVPLNPFADWIEPHQNRSLRRLLASNDVWGFSKAERLRIVEHWVQETRRREIPKLERLRAHHSQVTSEIAALHNQRKKDVLSNAKIIGATTNGAANLLPLLKAAAPRILIVEEAGECLEAHVLATMVPSIEQIILIGDPLQLRPHIENDQLSVDSSVGKLYRLDESLFERLVNAKLPYSTLATQRRMRPEIASLVRNHLYPSLTDHTAVLNYPSLKGLGRNCFFLDHAHGEDKQQRDSSSKTNTYEARMAVDLVVHFIKQGYKPGDIAVLSPYLGQVKMLKQLLSTAKLEVELDERDVRELNRMADDVSDDEDEEDLTPRKFESRTADLLVTLRSVDNFQGEEAKVVILSLVRNAGASEDEEGVVTLDKVARASIGFLKSENRSNVALSRAKHGMVIIGNATLFRERAPMWESVISTLEEQDAVGEALPIRCEQHPEETSLVKEPGMIAQVAPQGGCLKRCSTEMRCGHLCPRLCHPTDKVHANTRCIEPCQIRLDCGHVCRSLCGDPHVCDWIEPAVALPCGHRRINVPCAEAQNVEELECRTQVVVALPCEHTVTVECGTSVVDYVCKQPCGLALSCKHGTCKERCGSCRPPRFYSEPSSVVNHGRHRCEKILSCSHACLGDCKTHLEKGDCGPCQATCDRGCEHGRCTHKCGRAGCRSCPNPCSWTCEHVGPCENSCAMPCSRLPCDEPCRNVLACSHLCPSVCGENCAAQICPTCATPEQKSQVVDLLMMTTLGEVDLEEEGIDNRILTLSCGHAFTVETLDGIFELEKHYSRGPDERWAALKEVQPDALRPFSCPQCKTAIATSSAKRYGRPLKLVDLGAQEELALMRSSRSLGSIGQALAAFEVTAVLLPASELRTLASPKSNSKASRDFQRRYARVKSLVTPFIAYTLEPHGVSPTIAAIWTTATEPLVRLYRMAEDLVTSRSPHVNAYDSAFAKLQRQAKDELRQLVGEAGGDISAHDVQEEAYRRAKLAIGAPMPRAENRSAVEGVWMSLQIRLSLFDIGQSLFEELSALSPSQLPGLDLSIRRLQVFLYFLLTSSRRDAYSCVDLARFNAATRQEITSLLHVARLSLKIARYDCEQHVASAKRGEAYIVAQVVADIEQRQAVAEDDLDAAIERARDSMRGNRMAMRSLDEWLDTSTWGTVGVLAKEWSNLIEYAKSADFYAEVTEEEKRLIVEAMAPTFGHWSSGTHWYRCPQGHPFVIGDCGQANQAGVCPECGATLGGQGHHGSRMAAGTVVDDTLQGLHRATRTV